MKLPQQTPSYLLDGFDKIDRDLHELMICFHEVLEELGEQEVAASLPWLNGERPTDTSKGFEQAYSIAFQLLNLVEANAAARTRRLREINSGLTAERGLWGYQLERLKKSGFSAEAIAASLPNIHVEPVFTAHPTEAKRGAVLEQHRILYQLLATADEKKLTPSEQKNNRRQIKISLEKLWRSGEIFFNQPKIADERRDILFYLRDILPETVAHLDERLKSAWEEAGFSPKLLDEVGTQPRIAFGTWVGGDRDGHPFVTAEVTKETLSELRLSALLVIYRQLGHLAKSLPLSSHFQQPSEELLTLIYELTKELGAQGEAITQRYSEEPWRQLVLLLQAKLPLHIRIGERATIDFSAHRFQHPETLRKNLFLLQRSLEAVRADHLIQDALWPVFRSLDIFGFHLASLDIRQNSAFHDRVMEQILSAARVTDAASFSQWSEEDRLSYLRKELKSHQRLLKNHTELGSEAIALLSCYEVLRIHAEDYGVAGLGSLIVSMTRKLSDLLVVVFLAREAGMTHWNGITHSSLLPIVPLFETREDLQLAPEVVRNYLCEPSLKSLRDLSKLKVEVEVKDNQQNSDSISILHQSDQLSCTFADVDAGERAKNSSKLKVEVEEKISEQKHTSTSTPNLNCMKPQYGVMLGYSDSNKDCGIIASQWSLHEAQRVMSDIATRANINLQFFHGRGGTISRGAGPTHLFLEALPYGSLHGSLRMTEQGETIAQKYADQATATYHLELLLAGVAGTTLAQYQKKEKRANEVSGHNKTAAFLAEESRLVYQELIRTEGFLTFYEQATPIDVLEASRIGSRPKRRSNEASPRNLADLRAIPWVFSWNQSRYFLPGWFGVGTALAALEKKQPELFQELITHYQEWPFLNYVLSNVETNLASAHLGMMERYASLVGDVTLRNRIFGLIATEFQQTEQQLQKIFGGTFIERRPRMAKTLALRDKALGLLHEQQIITLQAWRKAQQSNPERATELLPRVLLSVNAIASGLRTTG